ncbi:relaxase/mobilization nuclease domain-containing protein [Mucilaginibacter rubeus]|uniref:Relaxase/mobilization nuclease domain-containing protein n=1 Tax=Mucilaginibacter rubeus TaxID=2027860 RepID=A0AAE6MKE0_9SPHI|nr:MULTISPECIES: relaxase/mobilization nuclease domain-containing protein [Mucilaginibacter]QEM06663.1 relaxase/mobilization nuclease domain-containing protein [Mucilaginibacter rubeus]QEM19252.1 relaxase/mobilization nuclease domain-containing protein [Mucilaginibacter gossypii]QTE44202.1 relaxase/mobilization nuclease domain-containing protein [Mucilaginibacter rubeus]QTE50803.1 relaxase/mobilization nuclease domain-containing protein [Mucilaginibacter rubeus]QTE55886.1 relaxase/mobilization
MIGKVMTGKSFGGCLRYVVQKHDAVILDAAGVRIQDVNQIINDFNLQRKYNPNLGKAVGHIALNWSVNDLAKLDDEVMVKMAKEYLQKMKIQDTQYLIVRHQDKEHPHLHIVYNRVNNDGKTIPDNFQKQRNVNVCKDMTLKHGLYLSQGKEQVKRQQLKGQDKIKYELFDAIKSASKKVKTLNELKQVLAKQGISMLYKYKSGTNEIQGISFSKGEYKFKGSEIDRSLSYAKLSQAIEQQNQPEKNLADQLRQAIKNAEQEKSITQKPEQTTYLKREPETHYLKQVLSTGTQLLGGLLENMPEEDDTPERKRKKKQEHEQSRGISR